MVKNDHISRQAAIDAIDVLKRNYPSSCFKDLCKAVDIAIKVLSAQPEPRWIPCEEALPKENGFYEVTVCAPYKPVRIYEYKPCDWYENENRWKAEDGCYVFNWFVEAWRECPKPYERSEDAKQIEM